MNKEELLTNGICPKCFKPLYVSKTTDAVLCDCDNVVPKTLEQKLKEIREKHIRPYSVEVYNEKYKIDRYGLQKIQSETYQLGRQEVIEEIENTIAEHFRDRYTNGTKFIDVKIILFKLNKLRGRK